MAFVSITRLRLRSPLYLIPFLWHAIRSMSQAKKAPGNLMSRTLADGSRTFWTATLWRDESSMRAFMVSGSHKKAMPTLMEWCDEASIAHWTQDAEELPDWQMAHRRLVAEGRQSKVRYPSAAHAAGSPPAAPRK